MKGGKKKTWEIVAKCEKMRRDMWCDREEEEEEEEVKWWGTQVFRLDSASESLESEEWLFDICKSTRKKKQKNLCFCHHRGSCSFLKLKMINQCCIELFCRHVQEGLSSCLRFPRNWQITLLLKARDEKQQREPGWWWGGCSGLITTLARWTRLKVTEHFISAFYIFSYYCCCCCFHMFAGLRDAGIICDCNKSNVTAPQRDFWLHKDIQIIILAFCALLEKTAWNEGGGWR